MPQETRATRKNYIGILCEETDEPHMIGELRTANDRQMGRYLRSLVAAVFNRSSKQISGPPRRGTR